MTGGLLQLLPATSSKVIMSCAVMYNIACRTQIPLLQEYVGADDDGLVHRRLPDEVRFADARDGLRLRQQVVREVFTH